MKTLAVIPARGGSTRLKDKNIHPLNDKPLIRWITETVVKTNLFEKVVVSTDSDKIFNTVSDLGVKRHNRPDEHATTKATVLDAMLDVMECHGWVREKYDAFAYFLPTHCPFVSESDIKKAFEILSNKKCDSVVGVAKMPEAIQLSCIMNDDNVVPIFDNLTCGMTNSKYIKEYYKPAGIYMGFWEYLLRNRNFFKGVTKGVIIPPERSVDINTIQDIKYAESLV